MKVAIVDDNTIFLDKIEALLRDYFGQRQEKIIVYKYENGNTLLEDHETAINCDLYLLDIEMPKINGLNLAQQLMERNASSKIVYLTSYEKYAFKSIKIGAYYYILKSEYKEELPLLIDRIRQQKIADEKVYTIKDGTKWIRVNVSNIRYLTKDGKYAVFHYGDKEVSERSSLEEVYQKLPKEKFVFIGRGLIINIDHLVNIQGHKIEMTGNEVFRISRFYYPEAMEVLTNYLGLL